MSAISDIAGTIRALGGEGNFRNHRLLQEGGAAFLCAKLFREVAFHTFAQGRVSPHKNVVLLKGNNQLRLHSYKHEEINSEFRNFDVYAMSYLQKKNYHFLPRFTIIDFFYQVCLIAALLVTRKQRYLNIFYLCFFKAICRSIDIGFPDIRNLICYNDKPFDVAAVVHAVNRRENTTTIVFQHGLIVSTSSYFPSVAQQFRAWGSLSKRHYCAHDSRASIIVSGRYVSDASHKKPQFELADARKSAIRILAAPSFDRAQVLRIVAELKRAQGSGVLSNCQLGIKLHPATKGVRGIRRLVLAEMPSLVFETDDMEGLSIYYDALVTKDSTSALDFLLLGKPVAFIEPRDDCEFPSHAYAFAVDDLPRISTISAAQLEQKNDARLAFLRSALDV